MPHLDPQKQRQFALEIVAHCAVGVPGLLGGGCVRDQLLRRTPKDYDVATERHAPEQIRELFGKRRTLAIGAAFGVITVWGPAGRADRGGHLPPRRRLQRRPPSRAVTFSSAQEDAPRRDFTINGLFYDPLEQRVIDLRGGQADLARRRGRRDRPAPPAIRRGQAADVAGGAVRRGFDFHLDEPKRGRPSAKWPPQIAVVSPERIAMEMRRMLVEPGRADAVRMLIESGLAAAIFPEILAPDGSPHPQLPHALAVSVHLAGPAFPLALAALLGAVGIAPAPAAGHVARRWRLSNPKRRTVWLIEHRQALLGLPASLPGECSGCFSLRASAI